MKSETKNYSKYIWVLLVLLLIPSVFALARNGFYGASDDIHIAWLFEFHRTLMSGKIPPRFVPDLSYGFGYPLFNFVFPFPFMVGELFHLIGFSLVDSIKLLFALSTLASGVGMYMLAKYLSKNNYLSILSAVIYVFTPYRATDIYVRGAIGEIVAFCFFPLITLSVLKIINEKNSKWIWMGSIATAFLVMSHNISAYMFLPFIILLIILMSLSKIIKSPSQLLDILKMFLFGFLISIYFWLPALVESRYMVYDTVFNFADHFPTMKQLITPYFGYGASVPGPYDGMSFFLGYANIFAIVVGVLLLVGKVIKNKVEKVVAIWAVFGFLFCVFLMNHRSSFVWESFPLIKYFQFPWRFLMMTTFLSSLCVVLFNKIKLSKIFYILVTLSIVVISFSYFKPQDFLGRTDEYYLNRYVPYPEASEEYRQTSEEYFRLPKDTLKRPTDPRISFYSDSKDVVVLNTTQVNALDSYADIETQKESLVFYNKYNFPGWMVWIDGERVDVNSGSPYGQVAFMVPKGKHRVEVYFRETKFRTVVNLVSAVSMGLVLYFLIKKGK